MPKIIRWLFLLVFTSSFLFACNKIITEDMKVPVDESSATLLSTNTPAKVRLSYGDSLFYLKNQLGNYFILPKTKPAAVGVFKSIPLGLVINSTTGRINITKSETGIRYKIYYVAANGNLLDSAKLVISGIDYKDAIYEIARTPNVYDTAFPIYNARPGLALPCGDNDDDDDDEDINQCVFDETDLNNDGNDDIAGVIQDKLLVDIKKGTIDVEASFHAGIFGSSTPPNGVNRDFTFYYRIQDASNRALNKITVRVYHFRRKSDIPKALLDTLALRNNISKAVNSMVNISSGNNILSQVIPPNNLSNTFSNISYYKLYEAKPKRPPIIIIVSQ